ncbi:MAG: Ger(x)C family spore germination protein [Bacillota bacterium]
MLIEGPTNRRSVRLLALTLSLLLLVTLVTGCWDKRELEDIGFVLALGLDKGEQEPYRFTVQIAIPIQIAPGRSGGGPGVITETVEGSTLDQVTTYMSSFRHKTVSFEHNKLVVIGKELAQAGLLPLLGETVRDRGLRRTSYLLVSTGTAGSILQALEAERNPAAAIEELVRLTGFTGLAPETTLHNWLTRYEGQSVSPVAPVIGPPRSPTKSGLDQDGEGGGGAGSRDGGEATVAGAPSPPKLQVMGTAVFRDDRLVDIMSGVESQAYLLMVGQLSRTALTVSIKDPEAVVTTIVKGEKPKRSMTVEGSTVKLKETIVFEGDVTQFMTKQKYFFDNTQLENVAKQVGANVKGIAEGLVQRMQGLGVDPFGFANLARARMSTYDEWTQFDWRPVYQQAEVSLTVKSFLRRTGATLTPLRENPFSEDGGQ